MWEADPARRHVLCCAALDDCGLHSLLPTWLCLCKWALGALLLTAPSVCCSDVLALPIFKQEEPQVSPENEARLPPLQYVLCAATSPAVKLHEETLTYLNQGSGQSTGPGQSQGAEEKPPLPAPHRRKGELT